MSDTPVDPVPPPAAPAPPSPAAQLQAALDKLNHPSVLDLQHRLSEMQNCINVMAQSLMPLLPTEVA